MVCSPCNFYFHEHIYKKKCFYPLVTIEVSYYNNTHVTTRLKESIHTSRLGKRRFVELMIQFCISVSGTVLKSFSYAHPPRTT